MILVSSHFHKHSPVMEKRSYGFAVSFAIAASLTIVSFASCIAAEFKKTKRKDLRLDGRLCFLPESEAFGLGITGLVCLVAAHIVGNAMFCRGCCSEEDRKNGSVQKRLLSTALLLLSWGSFGTAVAMLSAAASMSRKQSYGKGWVEGECYVVKDGVFVGSALLALLTVGSTIASVAIRDKGSLTWPRQVHAQTG